MAGCARDVLYLDLALEGAVRTALEGALGPVEGNDLGATLALLALGLENACLSLGSNQELVLCLKDFKVRCLYMADTKAEMGCLKQTLTATRLSLN